MLRWPVDELTRPFLDCCCFVVTLCLVVAVCRCACYGCVCGECRVDIDFVPGEEAVLLDDSGSKGGSDARGGSFRGDGGSGADDGSASLKGDRIRMDAVGSGDPVVAVEVFSSPSSPASPASPASAAALTSPATPTSRACVDSPASPTSLAHTSGDAASAAVSNASPAATRDAPASDFVSSDSPVGGSTSLSSSEHTPQLSRLLRPQASSEFDTEWKSSEGGGSDVFLYIVPFLCLIMRVQAAVVYWLYESRLCRARSVSFVPVERHTGHYAALLPVIIVQPRCTTV